jgi:hypothetical protein
MMIGDNMIIRSPLTYPGAKGNAMKQIAPLIPEFKEYREGFVGGGSVYLYVRQKYGKDKKYWTNDLYGKLYNFWNQMQKHPNELINQVLIWKKQFGDNNGKLLQQFLKNNIYGFDDIQKAAAYYTWNQTSFSGFGRGFSESNYNKKFNVDRIKGLKNISDLLQGTRITNLDYSKLIELPPSDGIDDNDVFVFCCLPGTKIRMKNERMKNIEDIETGELVFCGDDVLRTMNRQYNGNIYEFETMGIYDNLCITEEHPIAIIRQEYVYQILEKYPDGRIHRSKFKHQEILDYLTW